jgi:nicotinamidase-related amidase
MGTILNLRKVKERSGETVLVMVDLQTDLLLTDEAEVNEFHLPAALEKCRMALHHARQHNVPVAFVRHAPPLSSFLQDRIYPPWIRGFEPRRSDMIFERTLPSCYSSPEFALMAERSDNMVLMGLFGETSCLSTLMEGHHRSHRFTYLTDASCSLGHSLPAAEMHRSVVAIAGLNSKVCATRAWINSELRMASFAR